jgi:hypothetical protein
MEALRLGVPGKTIASRNELTHCIIPMAITLHVILMSKRNE